METTNINISQTMQELSCQIKSINSINIKEPENGNDLEIYLTYINKTNRWRQKAIDWALTKLPKSVVLPDGEVFFTRSSIRNALAHGRGKLKILSIPHIPKMLQKGVLFHKEKVNDFIYYNYAHPIIFEDIKHYAVIVVREDSNGKRFYDNEFITKNWRMGWTTPRVCLVRGRIPVPIRLLQ